jgi:hypothetical protein
MCSSGEIGKRSLALERQPFFPRYPKVWRVYLLVESILLPSAQVKRKHATLAPVLALSRLRTCRVTHALVDIHAFAAETTADVLRPTARKSKCRRWRQYSSVSRISRRFSPPMLMMPYR